jgi:hypothetical protein
LKNYPTQFYIFGRTTYGKKFRPSDWAERFCGVLSSYRPKNEGLKNLNSRGLNFSPLAHPQNCNGEKVVLINREIEKIEPLAWKFVISFINDNKLIFEEKQLKTNGTNSIKLDKEKKIEFGTKLNSNHNFNKHQISQLN